VSYHRREYFRRVGKIAKSDC